MVPCFQWRVTWWLFAQQKICNHIQQCTNHRWWCKRRLIIVAKVVCACLGVWLCVFGGGGEIPLSHFILMVLFFCRIFIKEEDINVNEVWWWRTTRQGYICYTGNWNTNTNTNTNMQGSWSMIMGATATRQECICYTGDNHKSW